MSELSSKFNFKDVDAKWTEYWKKHNLFHAQAESGKDSYTIVIPPPNITGILHMGHALNNTLQDIIIRYKRMKGFKTLWMPGTDHAGIATQNVVERDLAKEGKGRHDIGREAFLDRLWDWKKKYGDTIIHQLERLGASCDWPRTRFTMDDEYSHAVRTVFCHLYDKGLIYQGKYIINWCPRCHTALSDEEAEHQEVNGTLTHIKYPFKDNPNEFVVVATTRAETMLGDTAVAVNPKDKRYKNLVGKTLILPLVNREIKIIADEFVDPEFGSGAVKVTPAHDPNDFAMGKRHDLESINVMDVDATINKEGGEFCGLDRFEARKKIVKALEEKDLIVKIDNHTHAVGHCYRCHTMVEPYLSKQWFVKMEPLAKPATKAVKDGKIKFHPDRWSKVYLNWMENIRDWCISRQIWWGHRIPVWYCPNARNNSKCEEPIVSMETPQKCPHCGSKELKQDEDVLDTWFSSWLWPFATLGWPQKNKDVDFFYPGSSLFTASEIIFFWVARMIMAGYEFMGDLPFTDVYIHGTVRDAKGRKMSKSLGNSIDPLEIIEEYGADALRFSLIINSGQDLYIAKEKFEVGRNFANKVWNASRLVLMNTAEADPNFDLNMVNVKELDLPSQWIITKLGTTIDAVGEAIERFRYSEAESLVYEFFWSNFCDWYLEIIKDQWSNKTIQNVTLAVLKNSLKMMHPFIPFVTEEVWSHVNKEEGALCIELWPQVKINKDGSGASANMQLLIDAITSLRNIRGEWNVKPAEKINCVVATGADKEKKLIEDNAEIIKRLGRVELLTVEKNLTKSQNTATAIVGNLKIAVPLGDIIDINKEKGRLKKQLDEQQKMSKSLSGRLNNKNFLEKAPEDVVVKEKERLASMELKIQKLEQALGSLT